MTPSTTPHDAAAELTPAALAALGTVHAWVTSAKKTPDMGIGEVAIHDCSPWHRGKSPARFLASANRADVADLRLLASGDTLETALVKLEAHVATVIAVGVEAARPLVDPFSVFRAAA